MLLYVHIPFCRSKCRYCSFSSFPWQQESAEKNVDLILREAAARKDEISEPVESIFLGGGTPSVLTPALLKKLLGGISDVFPLANAVERTSEANPGTVTDEWLETAAEYGINRLSFGMQAVQPELLRTLGRIHSFPDAAASVRMARKHGFNNINLDLIFGIPGQDIAQWQETLDGALSLGPEHISAYGLIPEEGTPLFDDLASGRLSLPSPEEERDMYEEAIRRLGVSGLKQYEISNFAREGYECRHNIGYWTQKSYLGLGVSAASMKVCQSGRNGMICLRKSNPASLAEYETGILDGDAAGATEEVGRAGTRFETMMLGLRMTRGVDEREFKEMHGVSVDSCYGEKLKKLTGEGLILHENHRWFLTRRGMDVQNYVLVELMD